MNYYLQVMRDGEWQWVAINLMLSNSFYDALPMKADQLEEIIQSYEMNRTSYRIMISEHRAGWPAPKRDPQPGAHSNLRAISPPRSVDDKAGRAWICRDCSKYGSYDWLSQDRSCTKVHEPCRHCGGVRFCASDCTGIAELLMGKGVVVVGDEALLDSVLKKS